jgi:protein TonB
MSQQQHFGFSYPRKNQSTQLATVIALHVLAVWALVVATDRDTIAKLITPTYVMLMNEDKPTPPPPPPVPKPKVKPETVPKPEIDVSRVSANAIEVVHSNQPPAPVVVETPAPATPQPKLAAKVEASMICPTQVKPVIPRQALINNIQGLVRVEAVVTGGAVKEVRFLSGPRIFQDAVRSAMLQYKCSVQQDTVLAIQEFNFHFD